MLRVFSKMIYDPRCFLLIQDTNYHIVDLDRYQNVRKNTWVLRYVTVNKVSSYLQKYWVTFCSIYLLFWESLKITINARCFLHNVSYVFTIALMLFVDCEFLCIYGKSESVKMHIMYIIYRVPRNNMYK